jgi:hypothetical protein
MERVRLVIDYAQQLRKQNKQLRRQCIDAKKRCAKLFKLLRELHRKRKLRTYLSPGVYVREYDTSTYVNVEAVAAAMPAIFEVT